MPFQRHLKLSRDYSVGLAQSRRRHSVAMVAVGVPVVLVAVAVTAAVTTRKGVGAVLLIVLERTTTKTC